MSDEKKKKGEVDVFEVCDESGRCYGLEIYISSEEQSPFLVFADQKILAGMRSHGPFGEPETGKGLVRDLIWSNEGKKT